MLIAHLQPSPLAFAHPDVHVAAFGTRLALLDLVGPADPRWLTPCDECSSTDRVEHRETETHNANLCASCRAQWGAR